MTSPIVEVGIYDAERKLVEAIPCSSVGIVSAATKAVTWKNATTRPLPDGGFVATRSESGHLYPAYPPAVGGPWIVVIEAQYFDGYPATD